MKLNKIKELAAKTLKIGKKRLRFNENRLDETKEAITKQDIRDLVNDKAIIIKEIKGKKTKKKRKTRRRAGSIKINLKKRKKTYMILARKLRAYLSELKKQEKISPEKYKKLRIEIRQKAFKSKANLKERLAKMEEEENA